MKNRLTKTVLAAGALWGAFGISSIPGYTQELKPLSVTTIDSHGNRFALPHMIAYPPGPPGGHPMEMMPSPPPPPPFMFAGIDLTDVQIQQMANLKRSFKSENAAETGSLRALHDDLKNLLANDSIDESAVRRVSAKIAQKSADQSLRMTSQMMDMAKVLTPDQRRKIKLSMDRMELAPFAGPQAPPHLKN